MEIGPHNEKVLLRLDEMKFDICRSDQDMYACERQTSVFAPSVQQQERDPCRLKF